MRMRVIYKDLGEKYLKRGLQLNSMKLKTKLLNVDALLDQIEKSKRKIVIFPRDNHEAYAVLSDLKERFLKLELWRTRFTAEDRQALETVEKDFFRKFEQYVRNHLRQLDLYLNYEEKERLKQKKHLLLHELGQNVIEEVKNIVNETNSLMKYLKIIIPKIK